MARSAHRCHPAGVTDHFARGWVPGPARYQAGVFTVAQALAAGMSPDQVRRRRRTGEWVRLAGDALRPAATAQQPGSLAWAVALTWPDGVACLRTAAAMHRLPVALSTRAHAIVPTKRHPRPALVAHLVAIEPSDVVRMGRVRLTSRARTLFDCVGRLPDDEADSLMIWALTRELWTRDELDRMVAARPGRWGNGRRREVLRDTERGALGAAERRLLRLLDLSQITGWRTDVPVSDTAGLIGRADVLFLEARLVIEVDGMAYHGAARFQSDRTRQNRLVGAGYTVLRFTWQDLTERPDLVIDQIRAALTR